MKHVKDSGGKFRWRFQKGIFRRQPGHVSLVALVREQEKNWRGTLLAALTIGLLSGVIILFALYFTLHEERIRYERFTIPELLSLRERSLEPQYTWDGDVFIFETANKSWFNIDLRKPTLQTFADVQAVIRPLQLNIADLPAVSGIWPNPTRSAWLIRYNRTKLTLQDIVFRYLIVLPDRNERILITPMVRTEQVHYLHHATWGKKEYELFVQAGSQLYHVVNLLTSSATYECLTCNLPNDKVYGHAGWIYQQYFGFDQGSNFWLPEVGDNILLLATDEEHLRSLTLAEYHVSDLRPKTQMLVYSKYDKHSGSALPIVDILILNQHGQLKLNISWAMLNGLAEKVFSDFENFGPDSGIYVIGLQWYNETGFLVFGLWGTQRCALILFCQLLPNSCQQIWYTCVNQGRIDMNFGPEKSFGVRDGDTRFLTILPSSSSASEITKQLALLHIVPGHRNRVTWLTESPLEVDQLVHAQSLSNVLFTGSANPTLKHLYNLDRSNGTTLWCLTCNEINDSLVDLLPRFRLDLDRSIEAEHVNFTHLDRRDASDTNVSYRSVDHVHSSPTGRCFTTRWSTGYEAFGGSGLEEVPTRRLINQLTRAIHNASEEFDDPLVPSASMDPDAGLGVWCLSGGSGRPQVRLLWHSYLLLHHDLGESRDAPLMATQSASPVNAGLRRKSRSTDQPSGQLTKSAKQQQTPSTLYRTKARFMNASHYPMYMLYPPARLGPRPIPNLLFKTVRFLVEQSDPTNKDLVDGALVRIWFPPHVNDRYLQSYPVLVNVLSKFGKTALELRRLIDQLIVFMSGSLDVVVIQVERWIGEASSRVSRDGVNGELANYRALFKSLKEKYQNFQNNRSALIGAQGLHAYLAGLMLRSDIPALNASCAALISPVVKLNWHGHAEISGIFDYKEPLEGPKFDLTGGAIRYRGKELLLVHGTSDSMVPFAQTTRLVSTLTEKQIKLSLYPLYGTDHEFDQPEIRLGLLTKLATFLYDCLHREQKFDFNLLKHTAEGWR